MQITNWVSEVNNDNSDYGNFESYHMGSEPIGMGGFSKVFKVSKKGRTYAMKIPLSTTFDTSVTMSYDPATANSFKEEASTWAQVSDEAPGDVVRLIDYNIDPFPWMVMELAEKSMRQAITDGEFTIEDFIRLLRSLDRIHEAGVVHRDIKPENVLLVGGRWKFTDFGLSKLVGSMSKSSTGVKGTTQYMAPEQISRKKFGNANMKTDIWQMGIMLYEFLMGKYPYDTIDIAEITTMIIVDGPDYYDAPSEYHPIFEKAFAPEKDDRFLSAAQFAKALEDALGITVEDLELVDVCSREMSEEELNVSMGMYHQAMDILDASKNGDDLSEALELLKDSADMGFVGSQVQLGYMYSIGWGVSVDGRSAINWYTLAAEQEDETAQYNLGLIYIQGKLTNKNIATAKVWLGAAVKNGSKDAQKVLDMLEKLH